MAIVPFPFLASYTVHLASWSCIWKLHLEDISSLAVNQKLTPVSIAYINELASTHSHTLMTGPNKFHLSKPNS